MVGIEGLLRTILNPERSIAPTPPVAPKSLLDLFQQRDQRHSILVVDDSINVRRFVAITLEKAGYRVEQAKDGQDALEKLQLGLRPNAIICDIEMPRLDGFGFLAQVKSLADCEAIPVLMLTSRSGNKHRQLALNLGATDYFSKPFRKQDLLERLETVVTC
jgi:two-component system, chemotaxis family, sensor histidine kinase and response regulator PixL